MSPEKSTPFKSADRPVAERGIITQVPGFETTEPGSAELVKPPVDFAEQSDNLLVGLSGEDVTPEDCSAGVLGYMDLMKSSFDKGEVIKDGQVLTYAEFQDQLSALDDELTESRLSLDESMKLITRTNGLRAGLRSLLEDFRTRTTAREVMSGRLSAETLEDGTGEKVVRDLGTQALGAVAPEAIKDALDELSGQDQRDVKEYRTLSIEQRQAHAEHRFVDSKNLKEDAYYLYTRMSTAAKAAI